MRNFHARPLQQGGGDQRPQHGTGAVHAAVQAIGAALHVLGRGIGQDSVARRASQALAEPSRSALRKTTIVPQLPAKPMSGRDASASA